jgi:hypothetical protein
VLYALSHCSIVDLQFALWKLYFAALLFGCIKVFEKENPINYLSPFYKRFQSFPTIQWWGGEKIHQ